MRPSNLKGRFLRNGVALIKELIIDSTPSGATIALLQDKQLVELHKEQVTNNYTVGDIYLGRIKKIMPSLNAAFVDVGYEKDAFLHYLDLGPQVKSLLNLAKQVRSGGYQSKLLDNFKLETDINKGGKISELLAKNQLIPVQIAKEPISTKGPRLSSDMSIAGRYVVLVPFSEVISISKKIKSNTERTRLRKVVEGIKPKHFGVIIRAVSEGKGVAELQKDLLDLISKWESFITRLPSIDPSKKVLGEIDRTSTLLRDILNPDFQHIYVNESSIYEEIKSYVHEISPDLENIVRFHKHKEPIFEYYGVEKQIKGAF